jgi:hypothetical protein
MDEVFSVRPQARQWRSASAGRSSKTIDDRGRPNTLAGEGKGFGEDEAKENPDSGEGAGVGLHLKSKAWEVNNREV